MTDSQKRILGAGALVLLAGAYGAFTVRAYQTQRSLDILPHALYLGVVVAAWKKGRKAPIILGVVACIFLSLRVAALGWERTWNEIALLVFMFPVALLAGELREKGRAARVA